MYPPGKFTMNLVRPNYHEGMLWVEGCSYQALFSWQSLGCYSWQACFCFWPQLQPLPRCCLCLWLCLLSSLSGLPFLFLALWLLGSPQPSPALSTRWSSGWVSVVTGRHGPIMSRHLFVPSPPLSPG